MRLGVAFLFSLIDMCDFDVDPAMRNVKSTSNVQREVSLMCKLGLVYCATEHEVRLALSAT